MGFVSCTEIRNMSTPTKDNKRCHVVSGHTPNDRKKNRPERDCRSKRSLNYTPIERQSDKSKVCRLKLKFMLGNSSPIG